MSSKSKQLDLLYEHLALVLVSGTDEEIKEARIKYRKEYKKRWQQNKRATLKQYTVGFSSFEYSMVVRAAKKHRRSIASFVKQAALSICMQQYLIYDEVMLGMIKESFTLNYHAISELGDKEVINQEGTQKLLEKLKALEQMMLNALYNPMNLEEKIKEAISENPSCKEHLLRLIQLL